MNKNAYELRFDLLQMSKDMLDRQYDNAVSCAYEAMSENKKLYENYDEYLPKMFTPEEVIDLATKLQEFIDTK